ncbi:MAG: tetratricopeptide repeat protein [Bacteroidia bacterium]|jgi:tetratricopeptide (TPR) repeat protein|nr:tetratricopeptide repeat protein [Bacteroidia bacterium]
MTDKKQDKGQVELDQTILETTHKVEDFYTKHRKNINTSLLVIAAIAVGFFAYKQWYLAPKETEGQAEIFMAQKYFDRDSFNLALNGNASFKGFAEIADAYSGTKVGNLAHYYAGICNLRLGKFEEAIASLDQFSTTNELVAPLAEGAKGDAYVELGNLDRAVSQYKKAASMNENKLTSPVFLKKAGLVLEEQQQYEEAVNVYTQIKNDYPEAQEAQDIDKYIARASALKEGK